MIYTIILCTIFGVFILASFILGLSFGVKLRNNEKIEMPTINPVKKIKKIVNEHKEEKNSLREQEIFEIEMANIDKYDGTGIGQQELPR